MAFTTDANMLSLTFALMFIALGAVVGSLGPSVKLLAHQTSVSEHDFGWVFASRGIGYLIGSLSIEHLIKSMTAKRLIAASLILMGATAGLVPIVREFLLLLLVYMFQGMALGGVDVLGNTCLLWVQGAHSDPWMHLIHTAFGVGALISPIIVLHATNGDDSPTSAFLGFALFALMCALPVIYLPTPMPLKGDSGEASPPAGSEPSKEVTSKAKVALPFSIACLCFLFLLLYVGAEVGYGGWIFTQVTQNELMGKDDASYLTSLFWIAITTGRVLAIPLSIKFSPMQMITAATSICLVGEVLLMFASSDHVPALVWIGTAAYGLGMACQFPAMISLPAELGFQVTTRETAIMVIGGCIGETLIPLAIGVVFKLSSSKYLPLAVTIDTVMSTVILIAIFTLSKRKLLPLLSRWNERRSPQDIQL